MRTWIQQLMKSAGGKYQKPAGAEPSLRLVYESTHGGVSERDVYPFVQSLNQDGFAAWCARRGDNCQFSYQRIKSALDLSTGEALDPQQLQQKLQNWRHRA